MVEGGGGRCKRGKRKGWVEMEVEGEEEENIKGKDRKSEVGKRKPWKS